MAKPKPAETRADDAVAFVRMTKAERRTLERAAEADNRSLSQWAKLRLLRLAREELA